MSHTPFNWVHYVAAKARKLETDYALVVRGSDGQGAEGPDALELLKGDVNGCTLYVFAEPGSNVRALAAAAGIKAIYCGISRRDVARFIQSGYNFQPVVVVDSRDLVLRPSKIQRVREEILSQWPLVARSVTENGDSVWLQRVVASADYAVVVREGEVIEEGCDSFFRLLDGNVQGGVLYTLCEPDARVLARARAVGITAIHCVISQRDAREIGFFGPVVEVRKDYALRKEFLAQPRGKMANKTFIRPAGILLRALAT